MRAADARDDFPPRDSRRSHGTGATLPRAPCAPTPWRGAGTVEGGRPIPVPARCVLPAGFARPPPVTPSASRPSAAGPSLLSLPLLCPPQTSDMPQDLVNDLGSVSTRPMLQRPLGVPGPASAPGLPGGPGGLVVWEATATSQAGPARPSLGAPRSQRHIFSCELSFSLLLSFNFKSHGPAVPPLPTRPFLSLCRQRSLRAGGSA